MSRICLVSCVSQKAEEASRARDLYTSPLFRKAREIAGREYDRWYILSAEYGLVNPDTVIKPYDKTLLHMDAEERRRWAEDIFRDLERCTSPEDEITFFAGAKYRENLAPLLTERGNNINVPMQGLGIGKQLSWLTRRAERTQARIDLERFYALLKRLERSLGGKRILSECTGKMDWPERGVYFFFEDGEFRSEPSNEPRVVRVGTHMVSRGSKATFWRRLHTHRGTEDGRGNHRGSIFRLHIGMALMNRSGGNTRVPTWGQGQNALPGTRAKEKKLEQEVSEYLGRMPFLWLNVPDSAGPDSDRAYIERNSIGLLSNGCNPLDAPSGDWLGRFSPNEAVRASGLWNVDHVQHKYDRRFLKVLETYVDAENGKHAIPAQSIAPRDWYLADRGRDVRGQMTLFDEGEDESFHERTEENPEAVHQSHRTHETPPRPQKVQPRAGRRGE
jgi:hypothetical protein